MGMFDSPSEEQVYNTLDKEYMSTAVGGPGSIEAGIGNLANIGVQGIKQMTGDEDVRVTDARKMQEVKKYVAENVKGGSMIEYYEALAEAFKKFGMLDQAYNVQLTLEKLKDADETRAMQKETRLAASDARKKADAQTFPGPYGKAAQELAKTGKWSSEGLAKYAQSGDPIDLGDPVEKSKNEKYLNAVDDKGNPIYTTEGLDYNYVKKEGKKIPYNGRVYPVNPNIADNSEQAITGAGAKVYETQYNTFEKNRAELNSTIPSLEGMHKIAQDKNFIQGSLSPIRTSITRALVTAGLGTEKMLKDLGETELFNKYAMDFVLKKMGALGGCDSNEELRSIMESSANTGWTTTSIKRFVEEAKKEVNLINWKRKQHDDWFASGDRKKPFDFTITPEDREKFAQQTGIKTTHSTVKPTAPTAAPAASGGVVVTPSMVNQYLAGIAKDYPKVTYEQAEQHLKNFYNKKKGSQ